MADQEFRNTPRSKPLGVAADVLSLINRLTDIKRPTHREGDFHIPLGELLGVGALSRVADRASYGDSPFVEANGVTRSPLPTMKHGRGADIRDATIGVLPFAPLAAKGTAATARMAGEAVNSAMMTGEGPLSKVMGAANPMFAVKNKGGNWRTERNIEDLLENTFQYEDPQSLREWAIKRIPAWVKNHMGTVDDPFHRLTPEEMHLNPADLAVRAYQSPNIAPEFAGFHEAATGRDVRTPWEAITDSAVRPSTIAKHIDWLAQYENASPERIRDKLRILRNSPHLKDNVSRDLADSVWMLDHPENTSLYSLGRSHTGYNLHADGDMFGFRDIFDHLAALDLSPDKLNKLNLADAAKLTGRARTEREKMLKAIPDLVKEYPDGFKAHILNRPGQFAAEADRMRNSVRGYEPPELGKKFGGYDDYGHGGWGAIQNGDAKIYSIRNPEGESVATIELGPGKERVPSDSNLKDIFGEELGEEMWNRFDTDENQYTHESLDSWVRANYPQEWYKLPSNHEITQIKGPSNGPVEDAALPAVRDFVLGLNLPMTKTGYGRADMENIRLADRKFARESYGDYHDDFGTELDALYKDRKYVPYDELDDAWRKYTDRRDLGTEPPVLPHEPRRAERLNQLAEDGHQIFLEGDWFGMTPMGGPAYWRGLNNIAGISYDTGIPMRTLIEWGGHQGGMPQGFVPRPIEEFPGGLEEFRRLLELPADDVGMPGYDQLMSFAEGRNAKDLFRIAYPEVDPAHLDRVDNMFDIFGF